jgi:hypothetical protein
LLRDGYGVVYLQAVEVDVLLHVVELVGFVENLPGYVPVDFLSRLFILLLAHWLCSSVLVPS